MTRPTKPIIALDFPNYLETKAFLELMPADEKLYIKIGMELFYNEGPMLVETLKARGYEVFLDLKLYDIPNTVKSAMIGLAKLGVDMVNVHAAGGKRMMEAALEGLDIGTRAGKTRPHLISITQLTSMTEAEMQREQGVQMSLLESVINYSQLTHEAGLDGVVCSAQEAQKVKENTHGEFLCVTPGIRLASDAADDQRRIMTPHQARLNGSSYIVVGRSITQATDPLQAYYTVKSEWEK
ncbi:orotidine-5'-phosphate decarboxylase [Ignatzschineria sp. RMDPL8A]|uniref:orotidine-5'-phosphate decarboxylase n=1 Tax=Ignatzschineria sp. RMDPL8A TaxID=2999236 RepID=UPI002446613B|nr:orotidine-5'-phosphate decarboxylase [Ignatzschineria sp. RMDPL8A]MDG9729135.1 orotidine-5'-phosphate decarboxylase [Ignatzschineria sp. RMDPL8A]